VASVVEAEARADREAEWTARHTPRARKPAWQTRVSSEGWMKNEERAASGQPRIRWMNGWTDGPVRVQENSRRGAPHSRRWWMSPHGQSCAQPPCTAKHHPLGTFREENEGPKALSGSSPNTSPSPTAQRRSVTPPTKTTKEDTQESVGTAREVANALVKKLLELLLHTTAVLVCDLQACGRGIAGE
jgi:hypothetical protein